MRTKYCPKCESIKSIEDFYWNKKQNRPLSYCKDCHAKYTAIKRCSIEGRATHIRAFRKYQSEHRPRRWATKTVCEHKRNGCAILFPIKELMFLAENTQSCNFCGRKLNWNNRKTSDDSPSLDNLHNTSSINQLKDVSIVCFRCNATKSKRSLDEFLNYLKIVLPKIEALRS